MVNENIKIFKEQLANSRTFLADYNLMLIETIVAFASAKGFAFSKVELMEAQNELSLEELAQISGGIDNVNIDVVDRDLTIVDNSQTLKLVFNVNYLC